MAIQLECEVCGVEYERGWRHWFHFNPNEHGIPTVSVGVDACGDCAKGYMDSDENATTAMDQTLAAKIDRISA